LPLHCPDATPIAATLCAIEEEPMNLKPTLIALAAFACVSAANASITTITGDTTGSPTFNRALEDFSGLSAVGTDVAYDTYSFSVDTSGDYTFLTTGAFDTFVFLYSPTFSAASALTNGVIANDDLLPGFTTSGFAATLTAGTSYVYVTTGFGETDFGEYSTTIGGPGLVTAVPEPEAFTLMALGLGALGWARRRVSSHNA
jgi:hypothetical protein